MAPSTFASAAAGSNPNISNNRPEGANEWARRANGATQTFRRPSLATSYSNSNTNATSSSNHQRETSNEAQPARYVPPHRNGIAADARYSKEQLLGLAKALDPGSLSRDSLTNLILQGWEQDQANGAYDTGNGWQRRDDTREGALGLDAYWDHEGSIIPRGLVDMTEEEKEIFSTSVNSPLKQMNANNRDTTGKEGPLRRISISNNPNSPGGFSLNSPTTARTGGRRREPSESYPFPSQTLASPKPRDDNRTTSPPPSLRRRTTDLRESILEGSSEQEGTMPEAIENRHITGPATRINTNPLSAGIGGPSSPWGGVQQSPGFAPMGAFGSFGSGNITTTPGEKRPGLGAGRAESRFKGLMSKDSNDEIGKSGKDKTPGKPSDGSTWRSAWPEAGRPGTERDPDAPTGSAALGGGEEISPPPMRGLQNLGTPQRPQNPDDFGFSAFGMTPDTGLKGLIHEQQHGQNLRGPNQAPDTMSPTNTNPYQSPQQDNAETDDLDNDESELHNIPLRGLGGLMNDDLGQMPGNFGGGFQPFGQAPGDRSQTSSVGPRSGFPGLGGLGALPGLSTSGWGGLPPSTGTPIRDRAHGGLGDHGFGSAVDLQSPSLAGLGPSSFFGNAQSAAPGAGRGMSRIGSLFPQGGQDNLRGPESFRGASEDDKATPLAHGHLGDDVETASVEGDSRSVGELSGLPGPSQSQLNQQTQPGSNAASNQPPAAQQRTMVMPDRMRWIYRDPQGNTQGPWSGLEMHDWYKAGFFSPELLVKKFEDTDYEPLAQLIRRIGNSREPFLVPQIGIPHGPPNSNWGSGPLATPQGQPPFATSFPSFGTTLTADQQNALERRKQEEQYLMARQKEHLAQQQMAQRLQFQHQHGGNILPHPLQHHASAQSLQSQQSFGSVGSTHGFQPSSQAPAPSQGHQFPNFFNNNNNTGFNQNRGFGAVGGGVTPGTNAGLESLGHIREEGLPADFEKLHLNQQAGQTGQSMFGQHDRMQHDPQTHQQQINAMLEDRANLQAEQAQHDAAQAHSQADSGNNERLQQFEQLQRAGIEEASQAEDQDQAQFDRVQREAREAHRAAAQQLHQTPTKEPRSLTEQVQQAVSAQQSPNAWGKVDPALPQPFPPAPSQSPLPAPAAQRNRSHVADALHAESHSRSQSPSVETPTASIAPWAKEPAEAPRGPSLKEIQEIEAKNAAKAEALAAEARRAAAIEREAIAQAAAAAAAAVPSAGLPSSSTWASTGAASPTISGSGSAWTKATKPAAASTSAKSMAQIQKEEEARKKRLAAAALAAQQQATVLATATAQMQGKRYAELASKVAQSTGPSPSTGTQPGGAWTTVGSSGKTKGPVPTTPAPARTPSATVVPTPSAAVKKPAPARSTTATTGVSIVSAQEDFKRWAAGELRGDLNKGVNAEEFISNLLAFPNELDLVTEAVHSVSTTIDSRHFAEEFLRRRKQADRGVFEVFGAAGGSPANAEKSSGWSEVAKKGGSSSKADLTGAGAAAGKEELAAFKVVQAKKKGKR
ncbi:hypothetical protein K461DRAFT_277148 [Myriangium duriaei CBS 260.36]|uniref:GYF domain-containing protein n=1 Tax=Myriangium duriaei CBS 260.36 TaxID=1168546 RepID=A0A9P4MLD0_9PEZI|nr:hypothetical protein K461DRAFT_277148 [Myriangium duriaei CBS 260.36]